MIPKIYCAGFTFESNGNNVVVLTAAQHHHLSVLRLKISDKVVIFDGTGKGYAGEVATTDKQQTTVKVTAPLPPSVADLPVPITVAQAILTPPKMDWAIEKITELGATHIVPLQTKLAKRQINLPRLQRLAVAACEQCGRYRVPAVAVAIDLNRWLKQTPRAGLCLLLSCNSHLPLLQVLENNYHPTANAGGSANGFIVAVGAESGWTAAEEELLTQNGFVAVSLAKSVLRAETAGLVALGIINNFLNKQV